MKVTKIVDDILNTKIITPEIEQQIESLMWSKQLDHQDLEALEKLLDVLSKGAIVCMLRHR